MSNFRCIVLVPHLVDFLKIVFIINRQRLWDEHLKNTSSYKVPKINVLDKLFPKNFLSYYHQFRKYVFMHSNRSNSFFFSFSLQELSKEDIERKYIQNIK